MQEPSREVWEHLGEVAIEPENMLFDMDLHFMYVANIFPKLVKIIRQVES